MFLGNISFTHGNKQDCQRNTYMQQDLLEFNWANNDRKVREGTKLKGGKKKNYIEKKKEKEHEESREKENKEE
jgi:hypothetical protein